MINKHNHEVCKALGLTEEELIGILEAIVAGLDNDESGQIAARADRLWEEIDVAVEKVELLEDGGALQ